MSNAWSVRGRSVRAAALVLVALLSAAAAACSQRSEPTPSPSVTPFASSAAGWREQAQQLLAQHGLQSNGEPRQTGKSRLRSGEMSFELVASASRSLGLDLSAHVGEKARWYSLPLKSDDPYGPRSAIFVVQGGELVGAAGSMNADPGIVSLDYLSTH